MVDLTGLTPRPGVYLMRGADDQILYIGKAVDLSKRVRSYFRPSAQHVPKIRAMVRQVLRVETIVVDNEVEALILEDTLIKAHQPHYNALLKDDKTYPYLKITWQDAYPHLVVTRKRLSDGAVYYGPYPNAGALYETIRLIKEIFPIKQCQATCKTPCLYYHLGRCLAPEAKQVDPALYRDLIKQVMAVLDGKSKGLEDQLQRQMKEAAQSLDFERAGLLRDRLFALSKMAERQKMVSSPDTDQDVIGLVFREARVIFQVFQVRHGRLVGRNTHRFKASGDELPELLKQFLFYYYAQQAAPPEILLPEHPQDEAALQTWLSDKGKVRLLVPKRGEKSDLLALATQNARLALGSPVGSDNAFEPACEDLAERLGLAGPPMRIEGFDISHTAGTHTVASLVVFREGRPSKNDYRHYKIRLQEGQVDDFRSMAEVVRRRYAKRLADNEPLPELILIDGGKGQLSFAKGELDRLGLAHIPVVGLAKREEEIFLPGESEPLEWDPQAPGLRLLRRVRDEAHRFAVGFHRQLRGKRMVASSLDAVPGIGPKRRRALLERFGSLDEIKRATLHELIALGGLPKQVAEGLQAALHSGEEQA